ncbi:MAG: (E)-4-hydroxy-3-methylbut-2-enyl-diphosphate synthase [Chitinophagaceae bacterium]|nr:(E)-4-hydroxy-3-methylbut-2-enyl-diphosphate synthase [Chitinophagaceae bacterium]
MEQYCNSITSYNRLITREVKVGKLIIGGGHPIRVQTMTTTDTLDTEKTVAQVIRCIEAGAELVRITAPSKTEAENLAAIKAALSAQGYTTPIVADIHFTPNAAEIAATIIEKVRVNPGNYVDKKKFEQIEYTDEEYLEEIERIRERFTPLVLICKEHGTAMRIGTNHGSLSDRIMSRYGDTAIGMVESAMEFLRIARSLDYHQIILSMKSSNPQVMVQAYRLLIQQMQNEFNECYPLHLGVTEAGDGEDGRIKSAVGIGTLLEDGIGDTIRVSLTEDPELEIPVCKDLVKRYPGNRVKGTDMTPPITSLPYSPFEYKRRETIQVSTIGSKSVPVVVADYSNKKELLPAHLNAIGYIYDEAIDKWAITDAAADFIYSPNELLSFDLPGTLRVITSPALWETATDTQKYLPLFNFKTYFQATKKSDSINFVEVDCYGSKNGIRDEQLVSISKDPTVVFCLSSTLSHAMPAVRRMMIRMMELKIQSPVIFVTDSAWQSTDEHLIHFATETGALFLDGFGDGICIGLQGKQVEVDSNENEAGAESGKSGKVSGRNYYNNNSVEQFLNSTAFGILQATRTRISKTEYISCPSCGRTLFELQETTAKIRAVTSHLKGLKIAIMGCIVNGPGEMADADFGYVGSGVGKITLYKGKEVMKRNIDSAVAVDELILLLKEHNAWIDLD